MADQGVVTAALQRHAAEVEARRAVLGVDTAGAGEIDEADGEFAGLWPPGRQWAPSGMEVR
jgi:hypothetical protein